ncbi:MAG: hypothetical protein KBD06_00805 [Candidatus Pacebacteria bacterium]|nr:hypothetical protein [Candidatus Paceibacterota bacterium]
MLNIRLPFREDVFAIVDIAPGGARAALATSANGVIRVHAQTYTLISIDDESAEHSIVAIGERVDDVCKRLHEKAVQKGINARVGKVYCMVHQPWSHSLTVRKRVDYAVETKIFETNISALAKELLTEVKTVDMNALMEAAVIRTWLNGYPVVHPEGRSAHALVVSAIVSDVDQTVKKNAEAALMRAYPTASIQWRSYARAMQTVLGSTLRDDENYLAVDMGVDVTHLISVRDGFPVGERVVPQGLRTILTRIDPKRNAEETLGYIRMLSRDTCEGAACEAIRVAMASAEPELAKIFGEALGGLAAERRLANTLVLSANPDIIDWMKQFFSRLDFTQFTATTLPFAVRVLENTDPRTLVLADEDLRAQILFGAALVNTETA